MRWDRQAKAKQPNHRSDEGGQSKEINHFQSAYLIRFTMDVQPLELQFETKDLA